MEFMDVIRMRRAVRDFTGNAVGRAWIEQFISAAILAPSAFNRQPWAFAVVTDRRRIDTYGDRARVWSLENLAEAGFGEEAREYLGKPDFNIFYHAPALVIVMARFPDRQATEDCCLAAENLLLAARDRGIGTCWIGFARPWLNLPETKEELGIPRDYQIVAPIVLGHPKSRPGSQGRIQPEIHWL